MGNVEMDCMETANGFCRYIERMKGYVGDFESRHIWDCGGGYRVAAGEQYGTHDFAGKNYADECFARVLEYVFGGRAAGGYTGGGIDVLEENIPKL